MGSAPRVAAMADVLIRAFFYTLSHNSNRVFSAHCTAFMRMSIIQVHYSKCGAKPIHGCSNCLFFWAIMPSKYWRQRTLRRANRTIISVINLHDCKVSLLIIKWQPKWGINHVKTVKKTNTEKIIATLITTRLKNTLYKLIIYQIWL